MNRIKEVNQFLKDVQTYYLATVEGDQPRVRPFGTIHIFEEKLYLQTGRNKDIFKQITANPKVELTAFNGERWLRLSGILVEDDRVEAKKSLLDAYPDLRAMYDENDQNTVVFYFTGAQATFASFTQPPETFTL